MSVSNILRGSSMNFGNKIAVCHQDTEISYRQLDQEADNLAQGLLDSGLKPEQRVCVILGNTPDYIRAYFAIMRAGGTIVPINPLFKGNEIKHILNDSEAVLLITVKGILPLIESIWAETPHLKKIILVDGESSDHLISFTELLNRHSDPVETDIDGESIAACIYTSGTTGKPKGALLSHNNLTFDALACLDRIQYVPEDNHLCVLPLFHSFCQMASMLCPIWSGGSITLAPQFLPDLILKEIESRKISVLCGVPTMFNAMYQKLQTNQYDISSLRICITGGASMPVELLRVYEERYHVPILEGNGPTETSPVSYVNPPDLRKAGSVGPPLSGVKVKIVNTDGDELPVGEIGEICVHGKNVMKGYLNQPEATKEALRGGWFHTGDLGKVDEDGYVFILDRKKDMLIVGGLNVYPREVEECLYTHPKVNEAAVIGISDGQRGETPHAYIAIKKGQTATPAEFAVHCRERLANYKCPRQYVFVESLPKNASGKIDKKQLKEALHLGLM